jgi:hypothetical protein
MNRLAAVPLALLAACSGDFSINVDEDSSSSSGGDDPSSSGPGSGDPSSDDTDPDSTSSEPDSTGEDTLTPDTSEDSSSETGCTVVEECFPCDDAPDPDGACAAEFDDRPLCGPDGLCVACTEEDTTTCTGDTPVCESGSCVGCTYHDQCSMTACNMVTGACFDDTCVNEIDADGGVEFITISSALEDGCVLVLHERNGAVPYNETLDLSDMTVAILAADGERPTIDGSSTPSIEVSAGGMLFLEGIDIRGNVDASGLSVMQSDAYLDRVAIVQNSGDGIVIDDGHLQLRNTFVSGNGENFSPTTGIRSSDATLTITYSTVVFNEGDGADSFQCASSTGTIRNSIVLGVDESSFDCPGVTASYTAFDDTVAGMGNMDVSPAMSGWFLNPASNFHLTAAGAIVFDDLALWMTGDPTTDIDGTESRPNEDATPDVAGADVVP